MVKTKNIKVIRSTANSNDLGFMAGTNIFLSDCNRKP